MVTMAKIFKLEVLTKYDKKDIVDDSRIGNGLVCLFPEYSRTGRV